MRASHVNVEIDAIGVLHDRQRRALYAYVSQQRHDVSRDEAARAVSVSRSLAAFHLDRLVQAGLLEVSYRRLTGRQGPGAGRPSKLYRRTARQIGISLPERRYEVLANIFAGPLHEAREARVKTGLVKAVRKYGEALAGPYRSGRSSTRSSVGALRQVLDDFGAEPYREGGTIRLRNCPFDTVAASYRELVCGTNLHLVEGVIKGLGADRLGADRLEARLEPHPGRCCVAVVRSSR